MYTAPVNFLFCASTIAVESSAKTEPVTSPSNVPFTEPFKVPFTVPVNVPAIEVAVTELVSTTPVILLFTASTNIDESSPTIEPL